LTDCIIIAYYTDTLVVVGALLRQYKDLQVAKEDY